MLHELVAANRGELIERCKAKVGKRASPPAGSAEIGQGVPRFIDQLVEALRHAEANPAEGPDGKLDFSKGMTPLIESSRTAASHGRELLRAGYTVDQVVHDYGDLCQALTELAKETRAPVSVDEFRTLNRLLDNAIADAVSSYQHHRDASIGSHGDRDLHERIGSLADQQRRLLDTALKALDALKTGNLGVGGATGAVLEDSLRALRDLIDKSLPEIRLSSGMTWPKA
jgi:hypothetical protein